MLKEKLLEDLKDAMKTKNVNKKNAVQMVRTAILQIEKDKGIEVSDEQILGIVAKEVKTRKDAIAEYQKRLSKYCILTCCAARILPYLCTPTDTSCLPPALS